MHLDMYVEICIDVIHLSLGNQMYEPEPNI